MSAAPNQLVEISRQLKEQFSSHPAISITPTKGTPPDQYEIAYHINGLSKPGRGEISESSSHTIELTIPFGFPHFPPSCKPKSDTFHPDFDPAAICLGDFWNQDCQLPDLVIHIGQMINGEIYSSANAFNEDAAIWYQQHPDVFPLAEIVWREKTPNLDVADKKDKPPIDTLDESDLSTDFNFLALEDAKAEEDFSPDVSFPAAESASTLDLEFLHRLENQKKFFKLRTHLKDAVNPAEALQKLSLKTEDNIRKAENLHREAKKSEKRGDSRNALASFEQVAFVAADFPNIEMDLRRIRQALAHLEEITENEPTDEEAPSFDEFAPEEKVPAKTAKLTAGKKKRVLKTEAKENLTPTTRRDGKLIMYLFGGIVAIIFAGAGYSYWALMDTLGFADTSFSQCSELMEKGEFQDAKQSCEEALAASREVKYIHHERVEQLRQSIEQILQSDRLVQGLNGKILVDGKYLPQREAEALQAFRQLHTEAEDFFLKENWPQALERFAKILALAQNAQHVPADIAEAAKIKHGISQFRMVYDAAQKNLQIGKWQEANIELNKAETFLAALPEGDRQQYTNRLKDFLAKSTFEKSREQGDTLFAESDWQKAIAAYELALSTNGMAESLPKEAITSVHRKITRAELYNLIDQGNKAFSSGAWNEAIGDYHKAEAFLADHQSLLDLVDSETNRRKLSKIILQALIVRDRQLAANHLEKDDMASAGKIFRQLIEKIDNSSFSRESEFLETKRELAATVQTLDEKISLAGKTQYLKDEYRTIFIANYPTAIKENLVNPKISFIRDTGEKMIFKMQCTESGGGRPLTLVMHYAFDKKSGRWELFSEQE